MPRFSAISEVLSPQSGPPYRRWFANTPSGSYTRLMMCPVALSRPSLIILGRIGCQFEE